MLALAKALLAQSVMRQRLFDGFLRQPVWDMLLCLYVALLERAEPTQRAICASSGVPFSTARRWLSKMEQDGLVTCRSGRGDAHETVVEITEQAAAAVEGLLRELAAGIGSWHSGADRPLSH